MRKIILLLPIALSILSCSADKEVSTSKTYQGVELYKGATEFQNVRNDTTYNDHFEKPDFYSHGWGLNDGRYVSGTASVIKTVIYPNYNASNYDFTVYYLNYSSSPIIVLVHSTKTNDYFIGRFYGGEDFLHTPSLNGDDGYLLTNRMK